MLKKVTLTAILLLLSLTFSAGALADSIEPSAELKEIILSTKEQLNLDLEDWSFESQYISTENNSYWQLSWSKEQDQQYLSVSVRSVTYEIINADYFKSAASGNFSGLPAYNEEACLKITQDWAKTAWPQAYAQSSWQAGKSQDPILPTQRNYPYMYYFYLGRVQNNYPVSGQGIGVTVNGETGEITEWHYNWDPSAVLPGTEQIISLEQAETNFKNYAYLDLNYRLLNRYDPKAGQKLILTYVPKNTEVFMNALTGEIIEDPELFYADGRGGGGTMNAAPTAAVENSKDQASLSPAELEELDELSQKISKQEALELAAAFQPIPEGYQLIQANLQKRYGLIGTKACWNLEYQTEDGNNYLSFEINADTGDIISFYQYRFNEEVSSAKITKEEAQALAEALIQKYHPERQNQLEIMEETYSGSGTDASYTFQYGRKANGISYPENYYYFNISQYGRLLNYQANWEELSFPQPSNLIPKQEIQVQHLQDFPFQIVYAQDMKGNYYLTYYSTMNLGAMYNAESGELLDYWGLPVEKASETSLNFEDIAGHPAESDILTLAKAGIISTANPNYRPNDPITAAEWIALLIKSKPSYYVSPLANDGGAWYDGYWQEALNWGILNDNLKPDPNSQLDRLLASQTLINYLDYQKVAEIQGIYQLPAQDAGEITSELQGYAAITSGLGLIPLENSSFKPSALITRGEAAQIIMRMLQL